MRRGDGSAEKPGRKRWTRPPSWSTATTSAGVRTAWMSATRRRELLGIGVVAREEDDAAHERMAQHIAVLGRQLETGDIDHQWAQGSQTAL